MVGKYICGPICTNGVHVDPFVNCLRHIVHDLELQIGGADMVHCINIRCWTKMHYRMISTVIQVPPILPVRIMMDNHACEYLRDECPFCPI